MQPALRSESYESGYLHLLVAVDCSDHAGAATEEAARLASLWGAEVTGLHAYAAALHDSRFRQMEGGLPERYRREEELEQQREVHDDLITRGLSLISDSYLDQAERRCRRAGVRFSRRGIEGRNYRVILDELATGRHDLLVMGSQGLGAVREGLVGTVCERVVRHTTVDTLVMKRLDRGIASGPILVAIDGSARSFGGLLSAIELGRRLGVSVHAVAVFDPHFHTVAFNRIADVLSEEAGRVFRFKEQERLHDEIIDSGLARIYGAHLAIAESIAAEHGARIETKLLDGKPYDAILEAIDKLGPALLVVGKTGIHADETMEIGGNTEHLLRMAECNLLISLRTHVPDIERVARETISWTDEAEARIRAVPERARRMARMAILRDAQERGHTVVTASIVDEATARLCPARGRQVMEEIVAADGGRERQPGVVEEPGLPWTEEAQRRIAKVPEGFMRAAARVRGEAEARRMGLREVTLDAVRSSIAEGHRAMGASLGEQEDRTEEGPPSADPLPWDEDAEAMLGRVPVGFMRRLTAARVEVLARSLGRTRVTLDVVERKLDGWREHSQRVERQMEWDARAWSFVERAPEVVRGMVVREIEAGALRAGLERVTPEAVERARSAWRDSGRFHVGRTEGD